MTFIELFSGTGTFATVARSRGHAGITIDAFQPADVDLDVLEINSYDILDWLDGDHIDLLWASPPCQGFSVASIGRMWAEPGVPKHPTAELGLRLLEKTLLLIEELGPTAWFIENPRGMMRRTPALAKFMRHTVTFCQYGEERMKPTDIWTNCASWTPRPACKNGDTCHVAAPRGSLTGTQGIKGAKERGRLPIALCVEVIEAAEEAAYLRDDMYQHSPTRIEFGV